MADNMEWALIALYTVLFFYLINTRKFYKIIPSTISNAAFALKIIIGISGGYIYSRYMNGGDTHTFMNDARVLYSALPNSPSLYFQMITGIEWQPAHAMQYYQQLGTNLDAGYGQWFNNSMMFVRLQAFLCLFSFGYYNIHVLFMCFLSFTGLTALYRSVKADTSGKVNISLVIAIFFIPTIVFWGSMLLKEPLIVFLIGMILFFFSKYITDLSIKHLITLALLSFTLFIFKPFIFLALLPFFIAWIIQIKYKTVWLTSFIVTLVCSITLVVSLAAIDPRFNIFLALHQQQIVFMKFAVYYQAQSLIELIPFSPDALSVFKRSPYALWTALMRPYFTEAKSMFQYMSAFENIFIAGFIIYLISKANWSMVKRNPLVLTAVTSGILILIITAFTTPVLGALVRLKLPGLLLLITGLAAGSQVNATHPD
jgi:hypothetical protein